MGAFTYANEAAPAAQPMEAPASAFAIHRGGEWIPFTGQDEWDPFSFLLDAPPHAVDWRVQKIRQAWITDPPAV